MTSGEDGVWDVWQIEGPSMICFFRGDPHVHAWINVKKAPGRPGQGLGSDRDHIERLDGVRTPACVRALFQRGSTPLLSESLMKTTSKLPTYHGRREHAWPRRTGHGAGYRGRAGEERGPGGAKRCVRWRSADPGRAGGKVHCHPGPMPPWRGVGVSLSMAP